MGGYADEIWIGNWGRYNEGELVGAWMELPFEHEKLDGFLAERCGVDAMHEEVGIFDTSLDGPMGDLGVRIGDYTTIESVLLLADIIEANPAVDLDYVAAYLESACEHDPVSAANAILQADDIHAGRLLGSEWDFTDQEERIGYTMVDLLGGPGTLSREELERYFDYDRRGRELLDAGEYRLTASGAVDVACTEFDASGHGRESVIAHAERASGYPGDAADYLKATWGVRNAGEDPELTAAAAALAWDLGPIDEEKLACVAECLLPAQPTAIELANAAVEIDGGAIPFIELDDVSAAGLARALLDEGLLGRGALENYFDYRSYGEWMGQDLTIHGDIYIDETESGPDLHLYDLDDLSREAGWTSCSLDELEGDCSVPAHPHQAVQVERKGDAR